MRLRKLVERHACGDASGETLRPLSAQEIQQVAGAVCYDLDAMAPEPEPVPGLPGEEPPFPPELNPLPT